MRRVRSSLLALLLVVYSLVVTTPVGFASTRGYDMWFVGKILSVNLRSGRIRVARGPTETAGPAVVDCIVVRRALFRLHPGMLVDIQADTRSEPWRVIHLRPLELKRNGRSRTSVRLSVSAASPQQGILIFSSLTAA